MRLHGSFKSDGETRGSLVLALSVVRSKQLCGYQACQARDKVGVVNRPTRLDSKLLEGRVFYSRMILAPAQVWLPNQKGSDQRMRYRAVSAKCTRPSMRVSQPTCTRNQPLPSELGSQASTMNIVAASVPIRNTHAS